MTTKSQAFMNGYTLMSVAYTEKDGVDRWYAQFRELPETLSRGLTRDDVFAEANKKAAQLLKQVKEANITAPAAGSEPGWLSIKIRIDRDTRAKIDSIKVRDSHHCFSATVNAILRRELDIPFNPFQSRSSTRRRGPGRPVTTWVQHCPGEIVSVLRRLAKEEQMNLSRVTSNVLIKAMAKLP